MNAELEGQIETVLKPLASDDALAWLDASRREIAASADPMSVLGRLFPAARRAIGTRPVEPTAELGANGAAIELRSWQASDLGRALLLIDGAARLPAPDLVEALYRDGDENERAAIVRALVLLPEPETLKSIALETGRTNSVALFAALALDNVYPERFYTDHEFNQLVLKALFMGQPIGRLLGLEQRANADLARMCEDFYDERTAAGRPAPVDIWLAMAPHASARGLSLALEHLDHADPGHRFNAAVAVGRKARQDPELRSSLQRRLETEEDERVLRALRAFSWQH